MHDARMVGLDCQHAVRVLDAQHPRQLPAIADGHVEAVRVVEELRHVLAGGIDDPLVQRLREALLLQCVRGDAYAIAPVGPQPSGGVDQRQLAELSGLSVPTIQRMEASDGVIRGNVDSLMKLIAALDGAGIELIGEGAASRGGGRGVRLKQPPEG